MLDVEPLSTPAAGSVTFEAKKDCALAALADATMSVVSASIAAALPDAQRDFVLGARQSSFLVFMELHSPLFDDTM